MTDFQDLMIMRFKKETSPKALHTSIKHKYLLSYDVINQSDRHGILGGNGRGITDKGLCPRPTHSVW